MNMIKRNMLVYVRHQKRFYEWVNRMNAEGLNDECLQKMEDEERQVEMNRLKDIELARL